MAQINLLRNELQKRGPFQFRPGLGSLYLVLGVLAFEILLYGGLFLYDRHVLSQTRAAEEASAGTDFEINKLSPDLKEAISYQSRISSLEKLLGGHVAWSAVFDELGKYTYKSATYQTLNADLENHILSLSGIVPSYTDMGKLILGLKKSAHILGVELVASSRSDSDIAGYNLSIDVTFDPKLLSK